MNFEPQKFFISLVDFFSILMPGALLAYLGKDWVGPFLLGQNVVRLDGAGAPGQRRRWLSGVARGRSGDRSGRRESASRKGDGVRESAHHVGRLTWCADSSNLLVGFVGVFYH